MQSINPMLNICYKKIMRTNSTCICDLLQSKLVAYKIDTTKKITQICKDTTFIKTHFTQYIDICR